jgi:signal transduction histidine kinase
MNIEDLKRQVTARRHQLAVLDREGRLLASCDSLIPLKKHLGAPILPLFDVFEGLTESILALQPGHQSIHLPMMGFWFEDTPYRLSIEFWVEEGTEGILWLLSTEDIPTEKLRQIQQDRNETYIGLEKITAQELTLREYTARLEHAHQTLQRFAYIVSHDLKAPLRAIGNLTNWIGEAIETGETTELPEFLHLLRNRVQRMEGLIEGILQYHRAGHQSHEREAVDLRALLQELHETIFNNHTCDLHLPATLPTLYCSRTTIYQVFSNLMCNVRKYGNLQDCHIEIGYEDLGTHYQFGVIDNGPGIDPKHHARIFEIFQTLQSKDEDESTGIGLSIVQRIIEDAGGKIWVASNLGSGAAFWFTWPKNPN